MQTLSVQVCPALSKHVHFAVHLKECEKTQDPKHIKEWLFGLSMSNQRKLTKTQKST